ncbi:MAG TPA: DUF4349 domain-containing protein [Mucilaginibacter sp.]|nr:DUF4349 domain-containing protein [Mucilaginibacter sp.]
MKKTIIIMFVAAIALLAACKGKSGDYELADLKQSNSATDSAKSADTYENVTPKLVKTAQINFKVKNVRQASENIASLTTGYGGMVIHQLLQSAPGETRNVHISSDSLMRIAVYSTTADMAVKIPSAKLEDFVTKVSRIGTYLNMSKMDIDDRSLDYLSTKLKLRNRQELEDQRKTGLVKVKHVADVLDLKDDIVDKQIGNMSTDDAVKYSVVSLNFYQSDAILKEVIANDDPSAYNIPFFQRLRLALTNGWGVFVEFIIVLANLWTFILVGLAVWMGIVYYRRRTKATRIAG